VNLWQVSHFKACVPIDQFFGFCYLWSNSKW